MSISSRGFPLGFPKRLHRAQSKDMKAYAQSEQYHIIVESRVCLTWYQSHALSLVMSIESSNVKQKTLKEKGVEAPRRYSKKRLRLQKKKKSRLD